MNIPIIEYPKQPLTKAIQRLFNNLPEENVKKILGNSLFYNTAEEFSRIIEKLQKKFSEGGYSNSDAYKLMDKKINMLLTSYIPSFYFSKPVVDKKKAEREFAISKLLDNKYFIKSGIIRLPEYSVIFSGKH